MNISFQDKREDIIEKIALKLQDIERLFWIVWVGPMYSQGPLKVEEGGRKKESEL